MKTMENVVTGAVSLEDSFTRSLEVDRCSGGGIHEAPIGCEAILRSRMKRRLLSSAEVEYKSNDAS